MEKAGNILNQFLDNLLKKTQNKGGKEYYSFLKKWEDIVGKKLYGHTKIIDVKNGSLIVVVDHPGWLQMVKFKEKMIIKKVQRNFPQLAVKSIRISVMEECFQVEKKIEEKAEKAEKKENIEENLKEFENIRDEQLRSILKRLYMSIIKKDEES